MISISIAQRQRLRESHVTIFSLLPLQMLKNRAKKRSKRRGNVPAHLARAGSFSSVTDSTMSLNCITVTLNMDTVSFLGISIVGQVGICVVPLTLVVDCHSYTARFTWSWISYDVYLICLNSYNTLPTFRATNSETEETAESTWDPS